MNSQAWFHEQMLAKKWNEQPFEVAHYKENGWRVTFFRQPRSSSQQIVAFGKDREKGGKDRRMDLEFMSRFPKLWDDPIVQNILTLPGRSSIDCEIITPGEDRESVTTALRDPDMPIQIRAFAVPFLGGEDLRSAPISKASSICANCDIPFIKYITPTTRNRDQLLNYCRENKLEGLMLKSGGQYGKWWKLKVEETVDCFVTGTIPGNGKYSDSLGALVVSVYDGYEFVEIASCSGMTDEKRAIIHAMGKGVIGKVVEVEYQMVGSQGRLLHPRFVRFRDDKRKEECTYDQLKGK